MSATVVFQFSSGFIITLFVLLAGSVFFGLMRVAQRPAERERRQMFEQRAREREAQQRRESDQ